MTDSDDLNPYPTGSSSSRCTTSVLGDTVGKQVSPHLRETKKKAKSPEIGELCHDCIQAVIIRSAHLGDTTQHHHCHISILPWENVSKSAESAGSFLQSQTEELKLLPKAAYAPGRRHNPTVQKCLLFFSLPPIFFHCPYFPFPLSALKLRPVTRANFPRICPRFALSQPIKIASCTYSLTLTAGLAIVGFTWAVRCDGARS